MCSLLVLLLLIAALSCSSVHCVESSSTENLEERVLKVFKEVAKHAGFRNCLDVLERQLQMEFTLGIAQLYISLLHEYIAGYRAPYGFSSKACFGFCTYAIRFVRDDVIIWFFVPGNDFGSLSVNIINDRLKDGNRCIFLHYSVTGNN